LIVYHYQQVLVSEVGEQMGCFPSKSSI
jgi:hypothetical protein